MEELKNGEVKKPEDVSPVVKLKHPLKLPDGKVFEELSVDLDKLTLGDLHTLEVEYAALFPGISPTNGVFMTDSKYQALVIARVNGIVYDHLRALGARDAFNVAGRMGRFLAESV